MPGKPPTPQCISRLLRNAGFQRSTWGDRGVLWSEATEGFTVWRTFHQSNPGEHYVAVKHVLNSTPEVSAARRAQEIRRCLKEYMATLRAAGWHPLMRHPRGGDDPFIVLITAKEA